MVRQDAFNQTPVGLPAQSTPQNQRNFMFASVSSVETSAVGDYTILPAPGVGKKICVWGFQVDNGQVSTTLAGSLHESSSSGALKGRVGITGIGTSSISPALPVSLAGNTSLVFSASLSSGVGSRSYFTVYYTIVPE